MTSDPSLKGQPRAVRVGKYEVVAHIATGGMGAVYRARETETGREYALKVLTPEMAAKPATLERFRREARSAKKLQHENIVRVYDFDEYKGTYYIVMEFVNGVDLSDYIEDHPGTLDPEETRQIVIQAARALKHAHARGIVHRDIKPSNFLVTKENGRLLVKLSDLGLAREVTGDEFRVTRAGTTVGTVDYISPEQARDSGSADIRSDLYSLGCTWFHMLSGQPPFGNGGLAERILKHMQERPPDVRQFNPRASKALVKVLNKLLEKDPHDRYQTPAELLEDLNQLIAVAPTTQDAPRPRELADDSVDELPVVAAKSIAPKRKGKKTRRGDGDTVAEKRDTVETPLPRPWLWIGGAAALLSALLLGVVVLVVGLKWLRAQSADNTPLPSPEETHVSNTGPLTGPKSSPGLEVRPDPEVLPPLPSLLPPKAPPIDVARLRARLDAAFPKQEPTNNDPPLRIRRTIAGGEAAFSTLADALVKAPLTQPVTVEIEDNGPLFWPATALGGRDVTVRAAKGYRPLLVWDLEKSAREVGKPFAFLTVERGRLWLEGVDVVLRWPDTVKGPLAFVQATDSDFTARNCTFSLSGGHDGPCPVVRFVTTKAAPRRCRFLDCVLRGDSLQALDLDAPDSLVLFENCLAAGGAFPLLQARGGGVHPATIDVVRSTLVAGSTLLRLQGDGSPSLNWLSWDSLLSRSNERAGGELIELPPGGSPANLHWESVTTLYAGWRMLLTGTEPIRYDADAAWWRVMRLPAPVSARAIADVWPSPPLDLSEAPASLFRTGRTPVAFAASVSDVEPIGCVGERLPPLRDHWKALVYERFVVPSFDVLEDPVPPLDAMPVDLATVDLGVFLRQLQDKPGFGPKVALRLRGLGLRTMTPVKLKGVQLTLYFEQPTEVALRLALTVAPSASGAALLEIEGGGLDVINGDFALPDAVGVASLFKVSGGDLRLYHCRVYGPQLSSPPNYRGLIQFEGSGATDAQKGRQCVLNDSAFVTDKTALLLHGVGVRLLLKQSVVLAGGTALQVDPGADFKGRANVQCVLVASTLAARQAILQVEDVAAPEPSAEPIVVQSMRCAFLAPFKEAKPTAGVVRFAGDAVAHGLFAWQSDEDLFDKRFQFGCLPLEVAPPKPSRDWPAASVSLFGPYATKGMKADAVLRGQLDPTKPWTLAPLVLTPPVYGADLLGKGFLGKVNRP